ncbi:MAG: DeoR family transcriptional regulator [Patescibacteria group bacterium]
MDRREEIFKAIVKHFVDTAEPVGSKTILVGYHFSVSSATIRNDMASLENEGLIYQPHTSAGRIPTDYGYRYFVDKMIDWEKEKKAAEQKLTKIFQDLKVKKAKERIYDAISLLSHTTGCASFATLPDNARTFYIGLARVIQEPEFRNDPVRAAQVMEIFEENDRFISILQSLDTTDTPRVFIGKENALPQIQSCSLIVIIYSFEGYKGYMGLLGPTRMKYPFNCAVLEKVKELLEN